MAEVLTDERAGAVLRPFVRATSSVLRAMRESDPLRLRHRFRGDRGPVEEDDLDLGDAEPVSDVGDSTNAAPSARADAASPSSPEGTTATAGTSTTGTHTTGTGTTATGAAGTGAGEHDGDEPDFADSGADPDPDENDPGLVGKLLRQIDTMQLPGSATWDRMSVDQRCDWWIKRIGRFLALITSLPNFGGAITSRLPIRNALGVAGQGLVLCAIAAEHGVHDQADRVRLLAKILLDRELPPEVASGARGGSEAEDDARAAELSGELDAAHREYGRSAPKAVIRTVWRMARLLWEIDSELDKRPQGRFYHELLAAVPVIGVVGGYLGERSALRRVAKRGARWIRKRRGEFAAR